MKEKNLKGYRDTQADLEEEIGRDVENIMRGNDVRSGRGSAWYDPETGKGSGNTVDCVLLDIAPRETVILDSGTIIEIEHETAVRPGHGNDDPDDILFRRIIAIIHERERKNYDESKTADYEIFITGFFHNRKNITSG